MNNEDGTTVTAEQWSNKRSEVESLIDEIITDHCTELNTKWDKDQASNDAKKQKAIDDYTKKVEASLKLLDDTLNTDGDVTKVGYRNLLIQYQADYDLKFAKYAEIEDVVDYVAYRTAKSKELLDLQSSLESEKESIDFDAKTNELQKQVDILEDIVYDLSNNSNAVKL